MRKIILAGLIASSLLSAGANAGQLLDIQVLGRSGGSGSFALPTYWSGGQSYVQGAAGQEFRVRLTNKTGARIIAVLSVDGVNAITGQTAGVNQVGYIINAYASVDVDGWRKSDHRTAAFYFTELGDSLAGRTGRGENVGVIGAAVYREQGRDYGYSYDAAPEYERRRIGGSESKAEGGSLAMREAPAPSQTAPADKSAGVSSRSMQPSAEMAQQSANAAPLGTGHGRSEYSTLRRGNFVREGYVYETVTVRYDSYENLAAMGIAPSQYRYSHGPQAFPNGGYVADPPAQWRRW